jgi:hypothetical protein
MPQLFLACSRGNLFMVAKVIHNEGVMCINTILTSEEVD